MTAVCHTAEEENCRRYDHQFMIQSYTIMKKEATLGDDHDCHDCSYFHCRTAIPVSTASLVRHRGVAGTLFHTGTSER